MRRTQLYFLVALLVVSLGSTARAQTGLADIQPIKPVMMLLVDTSGSMERMPDTSGCVDCMPACANSASDVYQKNRWAVTLEALTGTFNNFRCIRKDRSAYTGAFDQDYFLPHYDFTTNATQASDGVLDTYKSRLKFGLMTFDGILTTYNGTTLVPYTSYGENSSVKAQIDGLEGMYSYPNSAAGWKTLMFPGCSYPYGVNAGARSKESPSGALISVGLTDSGANVQDVNGQIQSALLKLRPYGGTPIAAMLEDLQYYLQNDPDIKSGSDPYASCRKRYAVLLTDGAPDTLFRGAPFNCDNPNKVCGAAKNQDCVCPYSKEESTAEALRSSKLLTALWVLAFNVNDTAALIKLDSIAQAGGKADAFRALNPADLRAQLDDLMDLAQPDATSRSVPVVVNTGRALLLGGKQFEISAGFTIGTGDDEPWEGRLFRRRIECSGATPTPQELKDASGDLFHLTLNSQSTRQLYTIVPTTGNVRGSLFAGASTPVGITAGKVNTLRPDASQFSSTVPSDSSVTSTQANTQYQLSLATFDKNISPAFFGDANANGTAAEPADLSTIDDYLRGASGYRKTHKLGDIYHSNPVVLPPLFYGSDLLSNFDPQLRHYYEGFVGSTQTYYDKTFGRPGVVFVGSNDGILHAFNIDTWQDKDGRKYDPGHEFWGFVPPALFDKLSTMVRPTHQFMFDGTPLVKDVILGRESNGASKIATVLVAALRGAPAFVALDITHPEAPTFLWQRSFGYEGDTLGMPAIAHAKLTWQNTDQIRAVAILPGGDGAAGSDPSGTGCAVNEDSRGKAPDGRDYVRCWKMRGRSLYVVDVATGELVQEFDARHFPSPLTGAVAVDGQDLALSRAAYFADADGVLWRLSMINKDPSKWRVVPLWDLYAGEATNFSKTVATVPAPTYKSGRVAQYPPLLARDPRTGNLTIVFGTGDVDNLVDSVPHRVASLTEIRSYASDGELAAPTSSNIKKNWVLQLETGESVTGPLVMLDDAVYFATFKGPAGGADACEIGTSWLVGADVRATETSGLPKARLRSADGSTVVLKDAPGAGEHSLLLGLSIARDPVCIQGTRENDPTGNTPGRWKQEGNAGGGSYQLRSMVAGGGGTEIVGSNPGNVSGQGQRMMQRTLPTPNVARSVGWASSIE